MLFLTGVFNMKKIILICCFFGLAHYAISQESTDEDIYDLFGEDLGEIACEDLPASFKKYHTDRNGESVAIVDSLDATIKTLSAISDKLNSSSSKTDISNLQAGLEEAKNIIRDNSMTFELRSDNISFFMQDCVSKKKK